MSSSLPVVAQLADPQSLIGAVALHDTRSPPADDSSSSSLSEPEDRSADEHVLVAQLSHGDNDIRNYQSDESLDTEAETERLEKSPQAPRNVLLTPANVPLSDPEELSGDEREIVGQYSVTSRVL